MRGRGEGGEERRVEGGKRGGKRGGRAVKKERGVGRERKEDRDGERVEGGDSIKILFLLILSKYKIFIQSG